MNKINLLLIGAQKSGTTSLHHCLSEHPDIHMSFPQKEPRFFLPIKNVKKYFEKNGIKIESKQDIMRRLMMKGFSNQLYFGESSTAYSIGKISLKYDLPKKIFDYNQNIKILYMIRNPFSRIISSYKHLVKTGSKESWDVYFNSEKLWERDIYTSMYYFQLSEYLKYFSLKSIHIIFFEDFIQNPKSCLVDLWSFLQISSKSIDFLVYNASPKYKDIHFTNSYYNKIFDYIKYDLLNLSNLIGLDVIDKWDL